MMNFECAFYGMRALLFGLPLAAISSWLIYKGMVVGGANNIDFVFPWGSIGISVFSVLFVVFVTMLYAISKIKRENIIDALRDDISCDLQILLLPAAEQFLNTSLLEQTDLDSLEHSQKNEG
ncbi:FtsX-like permease family protein [Paenibacillus albidus]|uniref:FtsX-like permease family protein n=1 Tax=Paenibacillus albidus TaxID=2041023 RepID=UPI002034F54B|nr:FtsX-like permease family protein [Paenibacillus albidus]